MPFSTIHRGRFKENLAKMDSDKLVKLGVDTPLKRETSNVGVAMQLAGAIPSQGSNLIATAVRSGPRSGYYGFKYRIVKTALQERSLALPSRGFWDVAIPATFGIVTAALGAGGDGFNYVFDMTEFSKFHAGDGEEPVLSVTEWFSQVGNAAGSTIKNHFQAVGDPSAAAQLASEDYSNAYDGQVSENLQDATDQLGRAICMIMPGGEPLLPAESAKMCGSTTTSIAIGEVAGKGVEKLLPGSTTALNGSTSCTS